METGFFSSTAAQGRSKKKNFTLTAQAGKISTKGRLAVEAFRWVCVVDATVRGGCLWPMDGWACLLCSPCCDKSRPWDLSLLPNPRVLPLLLSAQRNRGVSHEREKAIYLIVLFFSPNASCRYYAG